MVSLTFFATMKKKETVIPQVRMFFKDEDRTNSFVMLRRKKTSAKANNNAKRNGEHNIVQLCGISNGKRFNGRFRTSELTRHVP